MTVLALDGVLRRYDWGSPTEIARLLGIEPDGRPAAELWFGAHPDDPSDVPVHGTTLDEVIGADPATALGAHVVDTFGPRLPYLLKILAAQRPLSLQVHPDAAQARAGFAAEDAAGVPRDAPHRNYRDPHHKPELLCALTPFDALCGFRPVAQTLALLDGLALPELASLTEALHGADPLRAAFVAVLDHPDPAAVATAIAAAVPATGPLAGVALCAQQCPGDVGVTLALLLNHVRLAPGEAIYLGAGNVHAYLHGTGVEIMASSDNVLRCGLTGKHVDVDQLLAITDFTALDEPRCAAVGGAFDVPVPDFRLTRVDVDEPTALDDGGPCIVLCTEGAVRVGDVVLRPAHAAFVPAGAAVTLAGAGQAFVAGVA